MSRNKRVLADILKGFANGTEQLEYDLEAEMFKKEVEHILFQAHFNPNAKRTKIWIRTEWRRFRLVYQVEVETERGLKKENRKFSRNYTPNHLNTLKKWAEDEGLGVEYHGSDKNYAEALLEIWFPKT